MPDTHCPACKDALPDTAPFPAWCPSCDWNLKTESAFFEWKPSALDKLVDKLRAGYARRQFEALVLREPESLRGRWTVGKAVAYVLAALVNGFPLLLAGAGIWLIAANWPGLGGIVWGGVLLVGAWALRARRNRMPKDVLDRSDVPRLYAFVDRVAAENGASKVTGLVVDAEFNASFQQVGLRQRSIIRIGLPLWSVLEPQERAALLSHEIAHGMNGDNLAHGFVGNAIQTLLRLAEIFEPDYTDTFVVIISPVLVVASGTARWAASLMFVLFWQRSQEAEFLADYAASRVGGSEAAISLLGKLPLAAYVRSVLDPISYSADWQKHNFFPAFRAFASSLPALEWERRRRLSGQEDFTTGTSHPPAWARQRFLKRHPSAPAVRADAGEMAAIDEELAKFERPLTGSLLAAYYPRH